MSVITDGKGDNQMDFHEFKQRMHTSSPVETVLKNPGGGTSIILSYSLDGVSYKRGNSTIYVSIRDLFDGYTRVKTGHLSSNDLKIANPSVFDSQARPAGHSCNCTFLFMALQEMGIVTQIYGRGVRGNPFYVILQ